MIISPGVCSEAKRVCKIVLRHAQNVVPKVNVCMPDAVANKKGVVPLMMPDVPPNRKPAPPAVHC